MITKERENGLRGDKEPVPKVDQEVLRLAKDRDRLSADEERPLLVTESFPLLERGEFHQQEEDIHHLEE